MINVTLVCYISNNDQDKFLSKDIRILNIPTEDRERILIRQNDGSYYDFIFTIQTRNLIYYHEDGKVFLCWTENSNKNLGNSDEKKFSNTIDFYKNLGFIESDYDPITFRD